MKSINIQIDMTKIILIGILLIFSVFAEKDYKNFVQSIKSSIQNKSDIFYHSAYERLAYLSDTYGPRLWGSISLEYVIQELKFMALSEGFDNVHLEAVSNFTRWERGNEELILHDPRTVPSHLNLIGLGGSAPGHVKAEVIVVKNYDELEMKKDQIKGKIVVYNQQWSTYGNSVQYRSSGAWRASEYGAVAALVRSVTPYSINSVHTGIQHYNSKYPQIPVAAITIEDAQMLQRMQQRKQKIVLELKMQSKWVENTTSYNVIFQIKGTQKPQQILLMGGHIDSWDTGSQTGANDDGGGFITCFEAMRILLKNNFRPKRTIRFIAWSGEQWGDPKNGAHAYFQAHKDQLKNHIVAFQDDLGSTKLLGFGYSGSPQGKQIVQEVSDKYMGILGAKMVSDNGGAVDTGPLLQVGIPTMINQIEDQTNHEYYFTYHHSAGDSMTIMDPDLLDGNVAGVACMFYILADLENSIPLPNVKLINKILQK